MENYLMYVVVAALTIASPGPGVILTINNAIQRSAFNTFSGIVGIATGVLIVSMLSATSIGVILATSAVAFTAVKLIGAAYLIYFGVKLWRVQAPLNTHITLKDKSHTKCYIEGLSLTISNPKPILFFMSLFPQFIDAQGSYVAQFITLSLTFCCLVIVIHSGYAILASVAKKKLLAPKGRKALNKVSGSVFVLLGVGLAASSK
ncbi:LysE family translocator [Moritella dasanensis]|uniref:LysE family translocator n=1 Tax=Moritella dasanensis TaxID=428031 RepID=UPI00037D1877|nr:LysE family translocator [Moritella dasanensis]